MRDAERLAILHQVDRGMIREESPAAIAEAALRPLRDLLGVPRAIVNLFDLDTRSEEHTSELQSRLHLVCRLLLEKKKTTKKDSNNGEKERIGTNQMHQSEYRL